MYRIFSLESYNALKERALSCLGLVVHFSTEWCEPCKAVNALLEQYAEEYTSNDNKNTVLFAEVNCENHEAVCEKEGITSVPYIAFFRTSIVDPTTTNNTSDNNTNNNNKSLERVADVVGAKLDFITMNVRSLYGENGGRGVQREDFASLDDYLSYLTKRQGVVAFITGSPSRPRCGFTGKLCELLQKLEVRYVYYDVMGSEEVCEGLKRYSDWPTFPQVYVNGELVGGYDVCKQLEEEGELKSTLVPDCPA